ncbi:hypothetical protein FOC4_g10005631 [Fusarium odoratissimum]|uniref:Uncharacterized protein n=1 Tax=Fusarium oxysporum f. sp. cubense (strain race 4) TaxID=2502994 RepID=N1RLR9_FUSC4|nr:hypothetical protein FOC4_g10005631 [Fusarium odoratissimum]
MGYVLLSPKFGLSSSSPALFRDWAIIELHQNKHQTPLGMLEKTEPWRTISSVNTGRINMMDMLWWDLRKELKRRRCSVPGIPTFTRTGVMSEAEMRCLDYESALPGRTTIDEDYMRVCMYGSGSGESYGITNTARSGDPGASIMGNDGRVAAMLTYGAQGGDQGGNTGIHHISYATSIGWLLEDIRGHEYDVECMGREVPLEPFHFCVESEN